MTATWLESISPKSKYAIIGGLASIPFTTLSYWQSGSVMSLVPVLFGGLLAAYLAKRKIGVVRGIGAKAGLIGALPAVWMLSDILSMVIEIPNPRWFSIISVVAAFLFTLIGFGFAALFGEIGGRIGGWLASRGGQGNKTQYSSNS